MRMYRPTFRLIRADVDWPQGHRDSSRICWTVGLAHPMRPSEEVTLFFSTAASDTNPLDLRYEASWGFDAGFPFDDPYLPAVLAMWVRGQQQGCALDAALNGRAAA